MKKFIGPLQPENVETRKAPWDFRAPKYDQRSSIYVNAGAHHGVGKVQPVGHKGAASMYSPALPYTSGFVEPVPAGRLTNLPIEVEL